MQDLFRVLAVVGRAERGRRGVLLPAGHQRDVPADFADRPGPALRARPALSRPIICAVVTVVFGIYPKPFQDACRRAFEAVRLG